MAPACLSALTSPALEFALPACEFALPAHKFALSVHEFALLAHEFVLPDVLYHTAVVPLTFLLWVPLQLAECRRIAQPTLGNSTAGFTASLWGSADQSEPKRRVPTPYPLLPSLVDFFPALVLAAVCLS
jgi:hypothetical protein